MPNEKNIVPYRFTSDQSRDEAAKNGQIGGIESGKSRRRKRSLKDAADLFLSMPVSDRRRWNKLARAGLDPDEIDNQMAIIVGLSLNAANGDAKAAKLLFDLLGEDAKNSGDGTNLLEAIAEASSEGVATDDLPEIE